jgi:Protein of unknown function (DUF3987)
MAPNYPLLAALGAYDLKPRGKNAWWSLCPCHNDREHPNLDIDIEGNAFLVKCRACGANGEQVVKALGLPKAALYLDDDPGKPKKRCTLAQLAQHKRLPAGWLRDELGWHDLPGGGVGIPYRDVTGKPLYTKERRVLQGKGKDKFYTPSGVTQVPYGLDRLKMAVTLYGYLIIVEGETDYATLAYHDFPVLALPGASMANKIEPEYIEDAHGVLVWREPDAGGGALVAGMAERLAEIGYEGTVKVIQIEGIKDPSELHIKDPDSFEDRIQQAIDAARPIRDVLQEIEAAEPGDDQAEEPMAPPARTPAMPFPVQVLPVPVRALTTQEAAAMPCPPDYFAVHALVTAATSAGATICVRVREGWDEPMSIYAASVGDEGTKKTPPLFDAVAPTQALQNQYEAQHQLQMREHDQKVKQALSAGLPPPPEPIMMQSWTSDTTMEALGELLHRNPHGILLLQDELSGWVRSMNQYKGGKGSDRQKWLSFNSARPEIINRKNRKQPLSLKRSLVCVAGCIQPLVLTDLRDDLNREDGFMSRIWFVFPDRLPAGPSQGVVTAVAKGGYAAVMQKIVGLRGDPEQPPTPMVFAEAAREALGRLWQESIYDPMNDDRQPLYVRGILAKWEGYSARLAGIMHLLRWASEEEKDPWTISLKSTQAAAALTQYFIAHAARVREEIGLGPRDRQVEQAVKWIRANGNSATVRELVRSKWPA